MTKVKFYIEQGDVFAYFPDIIHNGELKTCYAHVGQHSACDPAYLRGKRLAHPIEYADLLSELKSIGYDDLEVIDSRRTLSKILYKTGLVRGGAPMGRPDVGHKPFGKKKKVFTSWVPFEDGAYDIGGAYWGAPANLYVEYTKDLTYIHFYRKEN